MKISIWKLISQGIESTSSAVGNVARWGSLAMMILIAYDVFSRYLFNRPVLFSDEISAYLIVLICFLGAADALRENKHIIVDVITMRLRFKVRLWLSFVTSILSLVFLFIFTWQSIVMVYHSFVRGMVVPSILLTPLWIPQMLVPIGSILLCLQFLVEIGKILQELLILGGAVKDRSEGSLHDHQRG